MRTRQLLNNIVAAFVFVLIMIVRYLPIRSSQKIDIAYGPTPFLPSNQTFSLNSTPDIIRHLNSHCIHDRSNVITSYTIPELHRSCKILNGDYEQACRSETVVFNPGWTKGKWTGNMESTTTHASCSLPQLITNQSLPHNAHPWEQADKQDGCASNDEFSLVGKMKL